MSVTHPADHLQNRDLLRKLVDFDAPFWIRKRYRRDDGSLVWVLNHVSPVMGITGKTRIAAASFLLPLSLCDDAASVLSLARGRLC